MLPVIRIEKGDITESQCDAIVNAANPTLLGGGGVDGAIHKKGGPQILEQCRMIRDTHYPEGLPTGEAVITRAGDLPARYVIHTVGPVWKGGRYNEHDLLFNAYASSLHKAEYLELRSIAFPAISTGVYGFPAVEAAEVVRGFIETELSRSSLQEVHFIFYSQDDLDTFLSVNSMMKDKSV